MQSGRIIKALSSYYDVLPEQTGQGAIVCRARGLFKKKGLTPLVGDRVHFELTDKNQDEGWIVELLPRKNELVRPPIANIDQALLVFTIRQPELRLPLLDRFLVQCEQAGVEAVICLNKSDLCQTQEAEATLTETNRLYSSLGYAVLAISAVTGEGIAALKKQLLGKISVFAGQSGVGKSSLLNALAPGLSLATGDVSRKLGRGRHTTRHVELLPLTENGFVADTPGFSQLDFTGLEAEDLAYCFREFRQAASTCKFRGCLHREEPGCAVLQAVEAGHIPHSRHEHYLHFLQEILERKRRY